MSTLSTTPTQSRIAGAFRSLRHRNFQLFFGGQLISLVGTWMQSVAESWLVYRLTGSPLLLGAIGFASQIPIFLLSPIGGAIVDRHNRHKLIIVTQTLSMTLASILATITLLGVVKVWHIFVLASLLGFVNAFDIPARQAFIVEMVGKDNLMNAIALNSSMFNGARIVGPAVAGILVASIGEGWCFFANAVSYIAVIGGLLMMRVAPRQHSQQDSALDAIKEGFQWVFNTKPIFALLLLVGLVSLVGMPYAVLMPIFADRILHSGARGLGMLMGFSGAGALIGALTLAAKSGLRGLGTWVAASSACFGLFLAMFAFSRVFWASAALLIPVGMFMMVQMAATNTLIQSMVPDRLRGRVMSVYSMMMMGMAPLGALLAGALSNHIGASLTVALGGFCSILGSIWFGSRLPMIRGEARRLIIAQAYAGGDPPQEMTTVRES
ncbi:MAG TPA: MFS transporter [Terriglobales bacterium]|jgi:MFS family permease|nr:MFS transporter [Terriglobales bacterium]